MIIKEVHTKKEFRDFFSVTDDIYRDNPFYRSSEEDITRLLTEGNSSFHNHASVKPFLICKEDRVAGRFAIIHDQKLPEYVQVSFFEAQPDLTGIAELITELARLEFPSGKKIVIGLNGHLNYGAGILTSNFNEPPVFGLPYNREYYPGYFTGFNQRSMVSYRFPFEPFVAYHRETGTEPGGKGITVRKFNKRRLRQEIETYTRLNNACFGEHPYWSDRDVSEDFELFHPFRFLIREENLLFAEKNGQPIGFFLWYPDFNQLLKSSQHLGFRQVMRYRLANPIDTFRFTEIAVLPQYHISHAAQAMILQAVPYMEKAGFKFGEGGFIFEENVKSIVMTRRFLERATGVKMEPYRRYAVYERPL